MRGASVAGAHSPRFKAASHPYKGQRTELQVKHFNALWTEASGWLLTATRVGYQEICRKSSHCQVPTAGHYAELV